VYEALRERLGGGEDHAGGEDEDAEHGEAARIPAESADCGGGADELPLGLGRCAGGNKEVNREEREHYGGVDEAEVAAQGDREAVKGCCPEEHDPERVSLLHGHVLDPGTEVEDEEDCGPGKADKQAVAAGHVGDGEVTGVRVLTTQG
jgi:hypothetical protein